MPVVDTDFRKSSYSVDGWNCVEVKMCVNQVTIRDSKDVEGPTLSCDWPAWSAFVWAINADEFRPD